MCPAEPHESVNEMTKLQHNLTFVVSCKYVVEPTRHLHVQVTITVLNTIYTLQRIKQISKAHRCWMKREE